MFVLVQHKISPGNYNPCLLRRFSPQYLYHQNQILGFSFITESLNVNVMKTFEAIRNHLQDMKKETFKSEMTI